MLLAVVIMVVWFGVSPIQFAYAEQMRNMLGSPSVAPLAVPLANANSKASAQ